MDGTTAKDVAATLRWTIAAASADRARDRPTSAGRCAARGGLTARLRRGASPAIPLAPCRWSPPSSSAPRAASASSTSTRGCSTSASSSSARRSTTRSRTSSSPSCCTWSRRPRQGHLDLHQLARRLDLRRAWRSTTRCSSSSRTCRRSASASRCRWARCCSPAARTASAWRCRTARILIHQPSAGFEGQSTDIEIHAREILKTRKRIDEIYAKHTGQTEEQVHADMERDRFFKRRPGRRVRPDRPRHREPLAEGRDPRAGAPPAAPGGAAHVPRAAFGQAARASGAAPTSASSAHTTPRPARAARRGG